MTETELPEDEGAEINKPSTKRRGGLFVTDAELIEKLGVPEKIARDTLHFLDKDNGRISGFPQKSALWGRRRYWPAVREYLDRTNGLHAEKPRPLLNRR
jgi:hypothetical protein